MEPVDRSTIWPYDERGEPGDFFYSRYAHPTGVAAEERLGGLEGGEALLYPSGMGAITTVLLTFAEPGMTIAVADGAYFGTSVLVRELERWNLTLVEFDQTREPPPDADVVWVESPANPTLTLPNWATIRDHPGLKVCDATVATPVYLRALDEGADVVVHSATKYLTGHHDALLGATVSRAPHTELLRRVRGLTGITASPDAAYSLLKGLDTLATRMRRHTETATELAVRLRAHPRVRTVRYPGYSGLISFDVDDARAVETSTTRILNATSLGGTHSTLESRHRHEGDRIPRGLIRLSVGLEDADELWDDLSRALDAEAEKG